jgi:hypothetical protein
MSRLRALGALAIAAFVAACGSGGGGGPETTAPPLPSGKLDPTFGESGRVLINGTDSGLVVAPSGSAYVVGNSVIRIDAAGKTSTFFGPLGASSFAAPVLDEAGNLTLLYSPDRRVNHVAKIDASGQFVASFGANGVATLPFDPTQTTPFRLARDGQGNVYALGNVLSNGMLRMVIAKLDASGRQVASFGTNGIRMFSVGERETRGQTIAADRDGSILVSGTLENSPIVVRFDSGGNPSSTFGTGGYWAPSGCNGAGIVAMALDAASNIFVASSCRGGVVFKLDPLGQTVDAFREGGLRGNVLGAASYPWTVAVRANGDIYVGGSSNDKPSNASPCSDFAVAKLDSRGEAVASFGSGGIATFDVGGDAISNLGFDAEGRLYAGGGAGICPFAHSQQSAYVIYRLGS